MLESDRLSKMVCVLRTTQAKTAFEFCLRKIDAQNSENSNLVLLLLLKLVL